MATKTAAEENAAAYSKQAGKFTNFEVGFAAAANPDGYGELDTVFGQMKENVRNLSVEIDGIQEKKKKIQNRVKTTVERHARVSERLAKREAQAREYKKSIDAVDGGYQNLLESGNVLLDVLKNQMTKSYTPPPAGGVPT